VQNGCPLLGHRPKYGENARRTIRTLSCPCWMLLASVRRWIPSPLGAGTGPALQALIPKGWFQDLRAGGSPEKLSKGKVLPIADPGPTPESEVRAIAAPQEIQSLGRGSGNSSCRCSGGSRGRDCRHGCGGGRLRAWVGAVSCLHQDTKSQ
jgi:hypothetical protein